MASGASHSFVMRQLCEYEKAGKLEGCLKKRYQPDSGGHFPPVDTLPDNNYGRPWGHCLYLMVLLAFELMALSSVSDSDHQ